MRKKTNYIFAFLALASSTAAYAASSGFYVGVDGGRDAGIIDTNFNRNEHFSSDNLVPLDGFFWGAHAGYSQFFNQSFVLSGEVFWNRSNASDDFQVIQTASITNSVGASILPGWQLDNKNRLYARLGWIQSQFSNTTTGESQRAHERAFQNVSSNGIELGAGYLVNLTNHWDLRTEYDYAHYRAINRSVIDSENSYYFKPSFDIYTIGMDYNFDSAQIKTPETLVSSFNGWYTGVDIGRHNSSMYMQTDDENENWGKRRAMSGALGGLHAGYDWQLTQRGVLGAEVFDSLSSASGSQTESHGSHTKTIEWQQNNSFGASLLPGYQLNSSNLVYLRAGYIATRFSYMPQVLVHEVSISFNTTKPGFQTGLGYAVKLNNSWSVFGEYDYAKYASIHEAINSDGLLHTYDITPSDNQYKLGINCYY